MCGESDCITDHRSLHSQHKSVGRSHGGKDVLTRCNYGVMDMVGRVILY